jgi:ADP-heptose:LPS heptosyltransferase
MSSATNGGRERRRIAVFRALQLGDMLCAVPALRALRQGEPDAHITLIGLPWARDFVDRFAPMVDDLMVFPGAPGMPEQPWREEESEAFYQSARARRFDLAIQLHGSGLVSNEVTRRLGARRMAGFRPIGSGQPSGPKAGADEMLIDWPGGNEVERLLSLITALGYPSAGTHLSFPLRPADEASWRELAARHGLEPGRYVCVHPGARMLSRRWPVERFAAAAKSLSADWKIVITGAGDEAPLAQRFCEMFDGPVVNLCGQTALGTMAAVVAHARLVMCNDTGASHIAAAVRTPSVVVSCGSDSARWAPLDRQRHIVLADHPSCRPCFHQECPIGHVCADRITVDAVTGAARRLAAKESVHA